MNAPICPPVPSLPLLPPGPIGEMLIEICFFDADDRPERWLRADLSAYLSAEERAPASGIAS